MNPTDFRSPDAGRVVRTPQGFFAFVPAPLPPPALSYDADLVLSLSRADAALSELAGAGRMLPNPNLLIGPYLRREAVQSSRIEGTRTGLPDLLKSELEGSTTEAGGADTSAAQSGDLLEVRNYVRALEKGVERLKELPLSLRLVRELHADLMEGVRGGQADPGQFRRLQNWIGPPGSTLETAPYVPPPPQEMNEALAEWERFLHEERDRMPDLIQCALMHEQFEAIHPFLDGNGRVGRLLITLFLIERGRMDAPLLYLSDYIERHKSGYYDALQRVRTDGDWRGWLLYFLQGVETTARQGVKQARALMDLREGYRTAFAGKARLLALLDVLLANPYVTVVRAAEVLSVSLPTARQAIEAMVSENVLVETTGRAWGKVWVAQPILDALEPA